MVLYTESCNSFVHQVLTDNSEVPFEHLKPQGNTDDAALPVHPFQQRIVQLNSTPPSILARHVFACLLKAFAQHVAKGVACILQACMHVWSVTSCCGMMSRQEISIVAVASEG